MPRKTHDPKSPMTGTTLKTIGERHVLAGDEAAPIFIAVLESLAECYARGVARGFAPDRVAVTAEGEVVFADSSSELTPAEELRQVGFAFFHAVSGCRPADSHPDGQPYLFGEQLRFPPDCGTWVSRDVQKVIETLCAVRPELVMDTGHRAVSDLRAYCADRPVPGFAAKLIKPIANERAARGFTRGKSVPPLVARRAITAAVRDLPATDDAELTLTEQDVTLAASRLTRTHLKLVPPPKAKSRAIKGKRAAGGALMAVTLITLGWLARERQHENPSVQLGSVPPAERRIATDDPVLKLREELSSLRSRPELDEAGRKRAAFLEEEIKRFENEPRVPVSK